MNPYADLRLRVEPPSRPAALWTDHLANNLIKRVDVKYGDIVRHSEDGQGNPVIQHDSTGLTLPDCFVCRNAHQLNYDASQFTNIYGTRHTWNAESQLWECRFIGSDAIINRMTCRFETVV